MRLFGHVYAASQIAFAHERITKLSSLLPNTNNLGFSYHCGRCQEMATYMSFLKKVFPPSGLSAAVQPYFASIHLLDTNFLAELNHKTPHLKITLPAYLGNLLKMCKQLAGGFHPSFPYLHIQYSSRVFVPHWITTLENNIDFYI